MYHFLTKELWFPNPDESDEHGVLAFGGDLSVDRLLLAYKSGIFPWFNTDEPIVWYCPKKRMVLYPDKLKVSKSMKKIIKKNTFKVTYNTDFKSVIHNCASISRKDQEGTWITNDMIEAYTKLHNLGIAKSVEVWQNNELVGGLYGIDLGHIFCGESMFSKVSNASKVAFVSLVNKLKNDDYKLLDCQVYNHHLASLGAEEINRNDFLKVLKD